jgi:hypothetical protein
VIVDYERGWLRLREVILEKRSHGQDELLAQMARIELENELPEGAEDFDARPPRRTTRASDTPTVGPAADNGRELEMASPPSR